MNDDDRFVSEFERRRRRLPHLEEPGATYFLTFNLERPATVDLTRPELARVIIAALHHFDGSRYDLYDFTVMPDHVHLVLKPLVVDGRAERLSRIAHSLKSYTAIHINRLAGRSGALWQEEPYDRIIRNAMDHEEIAQYILDNAHVAGLVEQSTDWPWWGKGSGQY